MYFLPPLLTQLLALALLLPATARATRLVTRDKIPLFAVPREAFVCRWGTWEDAKGDDRKKSITDRKTNWFMASLAYLWECDWCASIWIGSGLTYLLYRRSDVALLVFLVLVASYFAGWSAKAEAIADARAEALASRKSEENTG